MYRQCNVLQNELTFDSGLDVIHGELEPHHQNFVFYGDGDNADDLRERFNTLHSSDDDLSKHNIHAFV